LDHVGLLTRTVADMALLLEAVSGYDPRDPGSVNVAVPSYVRDLSDNVSGLRVVVPREFYFDHVDQEIVDGVRGVVKLLGVLGAEIIEVELPPMKHSRTVSHLIQLPEILSYHSRYLPKKTHLYGADFRSSLVLGQFILAEHYLRAKRMLVYYRRQMADFFKSIDLRSVRDGKEYSFQLLFRKDSNGMW
jgi:aspartyl-tRNA(Asn)/glutamyl-tRNA(Gln) amidotransferase subunit A